jgi:predicted DNA-binding antitoxin AbrB/MazE fold protein
MANRLYNKQVSPKGYKSGGRVAKMGGGMMMKRPMMKAGGKTLKPVNPETQKGLSKLPTKVRNKMGFMKKGGRVGLKEGSKGAIKPSEKAKERTRKFLKDRQKKAAKIQMVSKLAKRQKTGKFGKAAPGASKATDVETALNTFEVQKSMDKRKNPKSDYDGISDRRLSKKEGSS